MTALLLDAAVWLLVVLWTLALLWHRAERRRIAARRRELAELHAILSRAQELVVSRRGSDGRTDERAESECLRLMAEYDARWEHLRAECGKRGLHLPDRPWRQR